jgi:histone deacetylase 1/2
VSSLTSHGPLEIIFTDIWGPASVESIDQNKYFVIFVDHFTKYIWLYPIKYKSDVFTIFPTFKNLVENYFKTKIISIYSDGGGEFQKLKPFLAKFGISHLMTPPHSPQHNGIAKRRHRHIIKTGLTLLHQSNLPLKFWSHAFQTTTYLINHLPTPILNNRSPFHALFGDIPNHSKLCIFGCLCFPWLRSYNHHKLEPRSRPCIFLGYSLTQSAYKCFDPSKNHIFLSRHVVFDETIFPYLSSAQHPPSIPNSSPPSDDLSPIHVPLITGPMHHQPSQLPTTVSCIAPRSPTISSSSGTEATTTMVPPHILSSLQPTNTSIPINTSSSHLNRTHNMVTRSQNGIVRPNRQLNATTKHKLSDTEEPSCASQALRDPKWRAAMLDEFNALLHNGTWDLVPPSSSPNLVGCKWVFRIKRNSDGTVDRYKARLVAKGFHKRPGIDYKETFSPVIKPTTIRIVLSLAVTNGWPLRQLDINNAFLHGTLSEAVFMSQPPGFTDSHFSTHVCQLRKAFYGLRQAPGPGIMSFALSCYLMVHKCSF